MTSFFSAVTNPIYSTADNSAIDCTVTINPDIKHPASGQTVPYTATSVDPMPYGVQLWADLNNGVYGPIGAYSGG